MKDNILENIRKGIKAYEDDVLKMTDLELYDHCFGDGDFDEHDFCVLEFRKRGLNEDDFKHQTQGKDK